MVESHLGIGELQQFRAFFRASERVLHARTLPEKLDVVADGVVKAGLFRRCLVSVYQHDRSDAVFFGSAGVSRTLLKDLVQNPRTRQAYLGFREYGVPLGEDCFYVPARFLTTQTLVRSERAPEEFGTWHPDDMFVAYLISSQGTYLGNLTADDPSDGNVPTAESIRTLSLFAKLAADFLEREFNMRRDSLTHLYNGTYLDEFLTQMTNSVEGMPSAAMLFADLDGLKEVNDRFGHACGDRFILAAARILQGAMPDTALFFRPYGDEFVALSDADRLPEPAEIEDRIAAHVDGFNTGERLEVLDFEPLSEESADVNYMLGLSAGLAVCEPGESPFATLQRAETRMYERKRAMYRTSSGRRQRTRKP